MNRPDEKVLNDQNEILAEIKQLEFERDQINIRIHEARKAFDESIKINGDMNAIQSGWNRHLEFLENQKKIHEELESDPVKKKEHLEFVEKVKKRNIEGFKRGVEEGWWADFDQFGPIPFPIEMKISDFKETDLMAHVMVKAKIFESVSDARKNGWNKPIEKGTFHFKKKRLTVIVI